MKIRTKIHLFSSLLMLVILGLTNIGIYFLFNKLAFETAYDQLQSRGEELTSAFSQSTAQIDPATILRAYLPTEGSARLMSPAGEQLSSVRTTEELKGYKPSLDPSNPYTIDKVNGVSVMTLAAPVILADGTVANVFMSQQLIDVDQNMDRLRLILFTVTILAMIPIIGSAITLSRLVTAPIIQLIQTMQKSRTSGTYERIDIPQEGKDELSEMGKTFNQMMDQLGTNYKKQEQFVSNASHELKTPLTVIESYARLLSRRGFDDKDIADEAVRAILNESARMRELIEQMLQLAKNQENITFDFQQVELKELVSEVIQPMRQAFGRDISLEGPYPLVVTTDESKLIQLLYIILDNARKYSDREIKVLLTENETNLTISITDFGRGIPQESLPHLFDRFYRVDEDRNRKTGGAGLGLSIADLIAEGIGAEITVESIVGLGTTFHIFLPKS